MDTMGMLLLLAVIGLIVCPPRYDPAIRLKERNEARARDRREHE